MIDHVTVTASDLERSGAFYDGALAPLGFRRVVEYVDPEDEDEAGVEAIGYASGQEAASVWLVSGPAPTHNLHVAFDAVDAEAVDRFPRRRAGKRRPGKPGPTSVGDLPTRLLRRAGGSTPTAT